MRQDITKGFDDAVRVGIERASKTHQNIKRAWVEDQKVIVENGKITENRVRLRVTFVLQN
jgi:dodecin